MDKYDSVIDRLINLKAKQMQLVDDYAKFKKSADSAYVSELVKLFNEVDAVFFKVECVLRDYEKEKYLKGE